ncbi:hypothetical protein G6R40_02870 [Chryseobacterium sp. POL2]|uniref:hypothetical protein n=1 Tax=Chryseobacterium sp. POL2 TaxID=2713414 RepID=UPI0013E1A03B|nr:hypothetical protein [Chryseobacterium sp. POL2]QIG88633.1 hypothetical protein G6R40_02665 [Chryseobacterium sp. POL2]QIG88674.1 hypothetical protein G6R40_02870 [Chryseobacterium sp. POL2]
MNTNFCSISANGKSIGEVREFEGLKVQEFRNVADAFSLLLTYKKIAELKSIRRNIFTKFQRLQNPAFCQYIVTRSRK